MIGVLVSAAEVAALISIALTFILLHPYPRFMALADDIRDYVNRTHAYAWRTGSGYPPDEPALVSAFLAKEMYRGLRDVLRKSATVGTNVLVKGIFTHQTPKILAAGQPKAVEIADLMLVHQHFSTSRRNAVSGRALLLQAKRTTRPKTGSLASVNQAIQFSLYQQWPEFEGTSRLPAYPNPVAPPLPPLKWDFKNPTANGSPWSKGAEYLTIFRHEAFSSSSSTPEWAAIVNPGPDSARFAKGKFPNNSTWSTGPCPPAPALARTGVSCPTDFAEAFVDFLSGAKGRDFQPGLLGGNDHWSVFVNRMLAFALRPNGDYNYNSANQGVAAGLRGRNLHFAVFLPALLVAAEDELDAFASGAPLPTHLPTSNFLYRKLLDAWYPCESDVPPSDLEPIPKNPGGGGHVPLLYVATIGPERRAFVPGEVAREGSAGSARTRL